MNTFTRFAMMAAVIAACMVAGCGTGSIENPQATLPEESSAGFLDRVSSKPCATQNDAARGILMLVQEADQAQTFAQRVETLRQRDLAAEHWAMEADAPVTRGQLAYMVYQACDLTGGVTLTLTGPSQRYCLRELQYRGIIDRGAWFLPVSGMELVAVLNRADAIIQQGAAPHVLNLKGE